MKTKIFFIATIVIAMLCAFYMQEQSTIVIRTKHHQPLPITYNGVYAIVDKSFEMDFTMPKGQSVVVEYACVTDKSIYYNYLKNKNTDLLLPFKSGNALAVSVNAIKGLDKSLSISNVARQPMVYDGQHFSSFIKVDSTDTHYLLTHEVNYLTDFTGDKTKNYSFKNYPHDTLYCIVDLSVYSNKNWHSTTVVPFKLVFK